MEEALRTGQVETVLTFEEIANLAAEGGQSAETLMNVVALIAKRFHTDVCSAYLLEPDRANLVLAATVGLRRECVGILRMAVQEGLTGWLRTNPACSGQSSQEIILASNTFATPGRMPTSPSWECR